MKFRMVKFARIPSYNELFSGDPAWATLEVAGLGQDGRSMVTKNDYPFPSHIREHGTFTRAELNSPLFFKTARELQEIMLLAFLLTTSSIQYENDDVMRPVWGDDYSICCCVSATADW